MAKLPEDSDVPSDSRASHPSFQSSEPDQPAIDPDPDDELDGDVVELVLRELDDLDEPDDDPSSEGGTLYAFGGNTTTPEGADIYDYEGDGVTTGPQEAAGLNADPHPVATPVDELDTWTEPDDGWLNYAPDGPSRRSIASVGSTGSIASTKSAGSIASALSAGSIASALSAGSIASAVSAGSIASLVSAGSLGSILSIGSVGSLLSIGSRNSILSIGAEDGFLTIGRGRKARSLGRN